MSDYFEFIKEYKNIYENVVYAEKLLESASSTLELGSFENQMRKTLEAMVNKLIKEFDIAHDEKMDLRNKIDLLYNSGIIDRDSKDNYHTMRMEGNPGSHAHETMDTRSEQKYYNERKAKDENAFKRLYVECNRFVNDYMTKAGSINNPTANNTSTNQSSVGVANGSVTYGSSLGATGMNFSSMKNGNMFTDEAVDGSYEIEKKGFSKFWSWVEPGFVLFILIYIMYSFGIESDVAIVCFLILGIVTWVMLIEMPKYYVMLSKCNSKIRYRGSLGFGGHSLVITMSGERLSGFLCVPESKVLVDNLPVVYTQAVSTVIRKNGKKSKKCAEYTTNDGYNVVVCQFEQYAGKWRFDVYINNQLVVEGDTIDVEALRRVEGSAR